MVFQKDSNDDLTVIPIELVWNYLSGFKPGAGSKFGLQQEMALDHKDFGAKAHAC
jgi:hypothetical protein